MRIFNLALCAMLLLYFEKKGELILQISNIDTAEGTLRAAVYNGEQHFLKTGNAFIGAAKPVKSKKDLQITISEIPFGKCAVAVYHDINNNEKLDKNYLGIPTEPYAFSNNPKVKWRSPTFSETQIEFNSQEQALHLELRRWKNY
jgi:uncharacterized protein (DUF2141 family)